MCFYSCLSTFLAAQTTSSINEPKSTPASSVFFIDSPAIDISDPQVPETVSHSVAYTLANELFGGTQTPPTPSSWNPTVLNAIQTEVRSNLNAETRVTLLTKCEPKGELSRLLLLQPSNRTNPGVYTGAKGIHLLADHHYCPSVTRRVFTKSLLNMGKNAAESAPIDDFLFEQNFAETPKAAQVCEKTGREIS